MSASQSKSAARRWQEARVWCMERRSHPELPPEAARAWQAWSRDPENLAAYKALDRFLAVASTFPMPALPSRAELLADTESDRLVENQDPEAPVLLEDLLMNSAR
jgi:ferric-dicitrate binding protein FerR (iron transport regulator)